MNCYENYNTWLQSDVLTENEKAELKKYTQGEIEEYFSGSLKFGTAGLRGKMGLGTARMNIYVVRLATQAFAEAILQSGELAAEKSVVICRDCRNNGESFAKTAACVMAANGISVRIFEDMRPTPELSFYVRYYGCTAGINITASHNPKEYNGYKVYGADGAQLSPIRSSLISEKIKTLDIFKDVKLVDYEDAIKAGLITVIGRETDEKFIENVLAQSGKWNERELDTQLKIVYTPFHGAGSKLVPEVLEKIGVKQLYCVEEQMVPDGGFSTVESPNPENPEGFSLAVKLADKIGADFILGSDPDADRVGIMIRNGKGKFMPVSGNLTGVLLLEYVSEILKKQGEMPQKPIMLKSIVTTDMAKAVGKLHGVECIDTFTGFKYIAEKKNVLETEGAGKVIFSYEESYGYMVGDFARDKDAVTVCMLLCEMAMRYSKLGISIERKIADLYELVGFYKEKTVNIYMEGTDGMKTMSRLMEKLRDESPREISGTAVAVFSDYESGIKKDLVNNLTEPTDMQGENVLKFEMVDGTTVVIRPSGTEPKLKIYIMTKATCERNCDINIERYLQWANALK